MLKRVYIFSIFAGVIFFSGFVVILPTFTTNNISKIALDKEIDLPLILNDEKEIKFIFFGYSGCRDICTPRLHSLQIFYNTLDTNLKNKIGVEFIDISTPQDTTLPDRFATFFHEDFKGIYLDADIRREYTKAFNVYFAPSINDKTEFDHTAALYMVQKKSDKKIIKFVYNAYPYDFKQIQIDIKELLNEQ